MKRGIRRFLKIIFLVVVCQIILQPSAEAQILGNHYVWQHRIAITSTAQDSLFDVKWEYVTIWTDSLDWYLKSGASSSGVDTTSWSSRDYVRHSGGDAVVFGPGVYLRRAWFRTVTGSDYINFFGLKKSSQY